MQRVKLFRAYRASTLEQMINSFIEDKQVLNVSFSTSHSDFELYDAVVLYEAEKVRKKACKIDE